MDKEEILLTKEEINHIIKYVDDNPELKLPNVIGFPLPEKTAVWKVTQNNNIIIIKGDEWTGFKHINKRHNYWENEAKWVNSKLDNPSKFNKKSIPIIDYANISDELYHENNLNLEKNNNPDLFELYIGEIENEINGKMKYRMLLYKDTKILHTLFPEKKINNRVKENIINFYKGDTFGKLDNSEYIIETPWFNENNEAIYNLVVFIDLKNKKEKCVLINLKVEIFITLFELDKLNISTLKNEVEYIGYSDFTPIEKEIKKFDKRINDSKLK